MNKAISKLESHAYLFCFLAIISLTVFTVAVTFPNQFIAFINNQLAEIIMFYIIVIVPIPIFFVLMIIYARLLNHYYTNWKAIILSVIQNLFAYIGFVVVFSCFFGVRQQLCLLFSAILE
jgi:RsiW-degrading membrane proteinase PrsW (M82 family)